MQTAVVSTEQWILHVDLDQFIAAVEVLRRPELAGRPVIVGGNGDPTERAVVATASYEAREYGVHSGMPLRTAYKRCPDGVYLAADHAAYDAASAEVMATLRGFDVVVEVLGWDEAFLGAATDDPEALARRGPACGHRTHPPVPARSGSATTSCGPSWPPGSPNAPACTAGRGCTG